MNFKHPELLYALFLLVIPILVHLFQLRRFKTTEFTNVRFLRKAVLQTRKSSRLKKFLILCTRLLLLACIILAFAQPYFPPASGEIKEVETVIWLDNSYSMQAKGQNGVLLRRSVQDLLEQIPENKPITLFTNEEDFRNTSLSALGERLQALNYSPTALSWRSIELKVLNYFRNAGNVRKNFIAISDFQHLGDSIAAIAEDVETSLVHLEPEGLNNVFVDSAYVSSRNLDETMINVKVSASGNPEQDVSLGLYDGEKLLARKTIPLDDNLEGRTSFSFPSTAISLGRIIVDDNALQFDNQLYFSINENPPVNVVAIGASEAEYLQRIYPAPDFNLHIFPENSIDYNLLSQAHLVILNEPEKLPFSLVTNLQQLIEEQVYLVIIPSVEADLEEYNTLFRNIGLPGFGAVNLQEKLITDISFDNPLYRNVFNEQVTNFEYPGVQSFYPVTEAPPGILKYQNGQPFLFGQNNIFVFTAAINSKNSNFKSAPLIVPTFFNIGNLAITPPSLYAVLGQTQKISVQANLQKDEILKLSSPGTTFIPQQQSFRNKVEILLENLPKEPGHYQVMQDSAVLQTLSFNIDRSESIPANPGLEDRTGIKIYSSIPEVFSEIKSSGEVDSLWKWFVIFALFFMLTEILILKFLK